MIAAVATSLAGAVVLAAAGALAYRARRQRRAVRSLMIRTPNGIAESRYVRIGGIDQWIQIRGEDRANPVLLFLHGAGMSMIPFTPVFQSWEKHFTVVQWDRRGVGRTLSRHGRGGSELQLWSKKALRMVLTAPGMSLADLYRFNSAIMFYPQPLYDETMSWTAPRRFDVPVCLLQGDTDEHTLTRLVQEYYPMIEARRGPWCCFPAAATAPC